MKNADMIKKIEQLYSGGVNIIRYLKEQEGRVQNTIEDIMISYDFQAGTYVDSFKHDAALHDIKMMQNAKLAQLIDNLDCDVSSILEAGVGEATALVPTLKLLKHHSLKWAGGNDISWSRIKVAQDFAVEHGCEDIHLFVADMFNMPVKDDAIDVVYTCHAMEPNGGKEDELLDELYRITAKYLILMEPDYERVTAEGRRRMEANGYVRGLPEKIKAKGWNLVVDEPLGISANTLNPTGLLVVRKESANTASSLDEEKFCCPITHAGIKQTGNAYFSQDCLLAYPIINGVPCLRDENAVLATKMK